MTNPQSQYQIPGSGREYSGPIPPAYSQNWQQQEQLQHKGVSTFDRDRATLRAGEAVQGLFATTPANEVRRGVELSPDADEVMGRMTNIGRMRTTKVALGFDEVVGSR